MFQIIFTVAEISASDSYAIVRLQLSCPDNNFYTWDIVSITTTLEFASGLVAGDKLTADLEKVIPE